MKEKNKISEAAQADFKSLLGLIVEFELDKLISFENLNKLDEKKLRNENKKNLKIFFKDKANVFFLYKINSNIVGYIFLSYDKNYKEGYVNEIYVIPSKRKKGIADKLLKSGIDWLQQFKCETINLTVNRKNKIAIKFYEKQNFKKYQDNYISMRRKINV